MVTTRSERVLENMPVGALGIIPLVGCREMGSKVDSYLVIWRRENAHKHTNDSSYFGYHKDSFIVEASIPRFGSGEAKGIIRESVRGKDLYLLVDVCNYSETYSMNGKKFVNAVTKDALGDKLLAELDKDESKGKSLDDLFKALTEGMENIIVDDNAPQPPTVPGMAGKPGSEDGVLAAFKRNNPGIKIDL